MAEARAKKMEAAEQVAKEKAAAEAAKAAQSEADKEQGVTEEMTAGPDRAQKTLDKINLHDFQVKQNLKKIHVGHEFEGEDDKPLEHGEGDDEDDDDDDLRDDDEEEEEEKEADEEDNEEEEKEADEEVNDEENEAEQTAHNVDEDISDNASADGDVVEISDSDCDSDIVIVAEADGVNNRDNTETSQPEVDEVELAPVMLTSPVKTTGEVKKASPVKPWSTRKTTQSPVKPTPMVKPTSVIKPSTREKSAGRDKTNRQTTKSAASLNSDKCEYVEIKGKRINKSKLAKEATEQQGNVAFKASSSGTFTISSEPTPVMLRGKAGNHSLPTKQNTLS